MPPPYNVLFICTGNSARSIMGEVLLNELGAGRFRGHSAGSHPEGDVHPMAAELLRRQGHDVSGLRAKSWDEFAAAGAPAPDFVVTVCDRAAAEPCPIWPGQPVIAHWGLPDPAAVEGSEPERRRAFADAYRALRRRIEALVALPVGELDAPSLRRRLDEIGRDAEDGAGAPA